MGVPSSLSFLWFFCCVVTAPKLDSSSPGASLDVWFVRVSLNFLIYSVLFHHLWYQIKISLWNSDISLLEKGWGNKILSSIWILFIIRDQRSLAPAVIMIILQCLSIYNLSIIYNLIMIILQRLSIYNLSIIYNLSALIILHVYRLKYLTKALWRIQCLDF